MTSSSFSLFFSAILGQEKKVRKERESQLSILPVFHKSNGGEPVIISVAEIICELTGRYISGTFYKHSIAYIIIPSGKSIANHYHPEYEEIYYILNVKGHINIGGREFEVGVGQAVYIESEKNYLLTTFGLENLEFIAISVIV